MIYSIKFKYIHPKRTNHSYWYCVAATWAEAEAKGNTRLEEKSLFWKGTYDTAEVVSVVPMSEEQIVDQLTNHRYDIA